MSVVAVSVLQLKPVVSQTLPLVNRILLHKAGLATQHTRSKPQQGRLLVAELA